MDAYDWSTGVYATAVAMAKCMTTEELSRTAILLTQLGTTLGTLAALRQMEEGGTGAVTGGGPFRSPAGLCDRFISARPRDPA